MENKTDKPYSLQDALKEVALNHKLDVLIIPDLSKEAAELYASKATEELRKERDSLKIELSNYAYQIDRAKRARDKAEQHVERLKESNKQLEEWKRQEMIIFHPILDWGQSQPDIPLGASITNEVLRRLEEHKVLKESNKELVEALRTAHQYMQVFMIRGEEPLVGENLKTDSYTILSLIQKSEGEIM